MEPMASLTPSPPTATFLFPSGFGVGFFAAVVWVFLNPSLHKLFGNASQAGFQKPPFPFCSLMSHSQLDKNISLISTVVLTES